MSKLGRYQLERAKLLAELDELNKKKRTLANRAHSIGKRLKAVGNAIYDLKHDGDTPHITDHAIVRYLERVEGRDIKELKVQVAKSKDAVYQGNVVVTINDETFYEDEL